VARNGGDRIIMLLVMPSLQRHDKRQKKASQMIHSRGCLVQWQCRHSMYYCRICILHHRPSVLWRCWLGGSKSIRPIKKPDWWGAGVIICLQWGANDLHTVQLIPLSPHCLCFKKINNGFILLVPAYPGCHGKRPLNECCCFCCFTFCTTATEWCFQVNSQDHCHNHNCKISKVCIVIAINSQLSPTLSRMVAKCHNHHIESYAKDNARSNMTVTEK